MHALLDHLSAAGFAAAPRALGLDEDGREVVSYAPGDVVWPGHFELLEHDEALIEVAQLIRRYHDVVANFVPPPGALWWDLAADPSGVHELVCHNDLAPGTSFAVPTEAGRSSTGTSPHRAGACGISVGRSSRSFR